MESINEALIECVRAAGGSKQVGAQLWPEKSPESAQRALLDCLNEDRPAHLTPEQLLLVLRLARVKGCHAGVNYLLDALAYSPTNPIEPRDEAADLMRWRACELFDAHQPCGAEANMAKYLAAKASWEAANTAIQTHGGFGFACEYDIERKFRETRLYQVAPISTNLILSYVAEHVLGLPRSF